MERSRRCSTNVRRGETKNHKNIWKEKAKLSLTIKIVMLYSSNSSSNGYISAFIRNKEETLLSEV